MGLSATKLVPHDTASDAFRVEADDRTIYDDDVFYTPLIFADGRVGYSIRNHEGQEEFIYLSPSERHGGKAGGQEPHVYLYIGSEGDPNSDAGMDFPQHFYSVGEDFD